MVTIKLSGGDLGGETMLVRCDLSQASAPVQVDYCDGDGFVATQYQCADCRHQIIGLMEIAKRLGAIACEIPEEEFDALCRYEDGSEIF